MRVRELTVAPDDFEFVAALIERLDRHSWGEFSDIGVELTTSLTELLHNAMARDWSSGFSGRRLVTAAHLYVSTETVQFEAVRVLGLLEGAST